MALLHRLLLCLWLLLGAGPLHADGAAPLWLSKSQPRVDAWNVVTVLADPGGLASLDDMRRRRDEFTPPRGPRSNLGMREEAMWLHLPLRTAGEGAGRWVLEVDYPLLNRIDVFHLRDGALVAQRRLGSDLPFDQRPIKSRAHTVMLELAPGADHQLYLRVQTHSAMVVPITLHRAQDFVAHESARQIVFGLLFGVALTLVAYSLAHGVSLRDPLFGYYAAMVLGTSIFFVTYTGVGQQYLWQQFTAPLAKIGPQSILLAVVAGSLFVAGALGIERRRPRVTLALRLVAAVALAALSASAAGWLGYRGSQLAATLLGLLPMLIGLPAAAAEARAGNRAARYLLVGWGVNTVGMVVLVAVTRGWLPGDAWAQDLFQLTTLVESLAWMRVLVLRVDSVRREAEHARRERHALHSLAHTDALTGLPNRRGLELALAQALPDARPDRALAVYLIDLDGFKHVNDRHGHDVGDNLLVEVGQRLRGQLRSADVVARYGGDEFVVMSTGFAGEADARALGHKLLEAFREPFEVDGQRCEVGLTIGFALAPHDGADARELLKHADAAMYAGKNAGRRCLRRGSGEAGAAAGAGGG